MSSICCDQNCEFFVTHKGVEQQIGYNSLKNYLQEDKIQKSFEEALVKKVNAYRININENTFITLEPVELRNY